ncbi:hypothetical protein [Plasmodium yoelii yoelii]|uniref:Uncharacterized protein n=2 Tax=Plasmodium yoelii TaxID=5861 RepID=Q7RI67_PLAYO|nr:hypothetical protein [Plasmodium yoelii yoelii]
MIAVVKKEITFTRVIIALSIIFLMSFAYVSNEDHVIRFKNYVTSFIPSSFMQSPQKSTGGCSCSKKANAALASPKGEDQPPFECPLVTLRNKLLEELEKASQREKMKEAANGSTPIVEGSETTPIVTFPPEPEVVPSAVPAIAPAPVLPAITEVPYAAPTPSQPIAGEIGKTA